MTLEGLLAVAGVVVAVYAVARPVQRRSISLFLPVWLMPVSLILPAGILLWKEGARVFGYEFFPWSDFGLTLITFTLPIIATCVAVGLWHNARITQSKDRRFRDFIVTCLREGEFDELVRIIHRNIERLAVTCTPDTLDLLFEPRFVEAMVHARTWIHLRLLADNRLLDRLGNRVQTLAGCVLRELLFADNSPLRGSVIVEEGGDETLHYTDAEDDLIASTLRHPQWYHRCRVGYQLLIGACERIDSGELDIVYNKPDSRYVTHQGVATRTRCPVFLAEKTIAHVLKISLQTGNASAQDTHVDAADLYQLFMAVHDHSKYSPETWDEPDGFGDYPTPFGFVLAQILMDYERACREAWRNSDCGARHPSEAVLPVARMWAYCVMFLAKDGGRVSRKLRIGGAISYLDWTLERQHASQESDSKAAWAKVFVDGLKEAVQSCGSEGSDFLTQATNGLDICKPHILGCDEWLRKEFQLAPR